MTRCVLGYALLADGPSDRALLPIITWLLSQQAPQVDLAAPGFLARTGSLAEGMRAAVAEHRPDILFVHRDAENQGLEPRLAEIPRIEHCVVRVVPVRMTEAWLLFDEQAIRAAAGRPAGRVPLDLPAVQRTETLADPNTRLKEALLGAAEVTGRRRKRLQQDLGSRAHRVAELIGDFTPLRKLPAFAHFEDECARALRTLPEGGPPP
jgi:hypothetical protein